MKVGILGSGGREHALCMALNRSKKVSKIYCFPGNAGTKSIAENIEINHDNFEEIKDFILVSQIDIVIVGPEKPLVEGIVDYLEKYNIKVFGPNELCSKLEGSKTFTKNLCKKYNIPTADFGIFINSKDALSFLENCNLPVVIKADGLAAGKGVYICNDKAEYSAAVKDIFDGKFGKAEKILIEEFLVGEEMSFFVICDGKNFKKFGTAQDHKRVGEGDKGKNTGGMGAYSPSRLDNEILNKKILDQIIKPTLKGLKELNTSFKGFLYAGLMIVKGEPFLIEYNVRMGDPECQTILPRLKSDLAEIVEACINEKLIETNVEWFNDKSLCIVLCSKGYPEDYRKNLEIVNIKNIDLNENQFIFHAGTIEKKNKIFSNGGRVLNFVVKSRDFESCRNQALKLIEKIDWNEGFYRRDIGFKVIN